MGRGPEETFSPRRCAGGPQGHGRRSASVASRSRDAHRNHSEPAPRSCRTAVIQETRGNKWRRGCGENWKLVRGMKVPEKLKIELPHDPEIPLLGINHCLWSHQTSTRWSRQPLFLPSSNSPSFLLISSLSSFPQLQFHNLSL